MTVGLDIDGTITAYPKLYALLSQTIRAIGGRVVIISARPRSPEALRITKQELTTLGIHFDRVQLLPLEDEQDIRYPFNASEDDLWLRAAYQKLTVCVREGVQVMVDDDPTVVQMLRTYAPEIHVLQPVNN